MQPESLRILRLLCALLFGRIVLCMHYMHYCMLCNWNLQPFYRCFSKWNSMLASMPAPECICLVPLECTKKGSGLPQSQFG